MIQNLTALMSYTSAQVDINLHLKLMIDLLFHSSYHGLDYGFVWGCFQWCMQRCANNFARFPHFAYYLLNLGFGKIVEVKHFRSEQSEMVVVSYSLGLSYK